MKTPILQSELALCCLYCTTCLMNMFILFLPRFSSGELIIEGLRKNRKAAERSIKDILGAAAKMFPRIVWEYLHADGNWHEFTKEDSEILDQAFEVCHVFSNI